MFHFFEYTNLINITKIKKVIIKIAGLTYESYFDMSYLLN